MEKARPICVGSDILLHNIWIGGFLVDFNLPVATPLNFA